MSKWPSGEAGFPFPLVGEGGERHRREPGEGALPSPPSAPSPGLASRVHPHPQGEREKSICIARIGTPHGVRGAVKLWTFTEDPFAVTRYGKLSTKDGSRQFEVANAREARGHLVAMLKGIATREDAERLNGIELYVARDELPATNADEYYHADLIGLSAVTAANEAIGRVTAIHNFGAGDIIEIAPPNGPALLLPFTNAVVPTVDIAGGHVVVELPGEVEGEENPK